MTGRIVWRRLAEQDVAEAYLHIAADSVEDAERFLDGIERSLARLLAHPEAGRLRTFRSARASGVRSFPVARFRSYLVFYRADEKGLEVLRLLHGARDLPGELSDEG